VLQLESNTAMNPAKKMDNDFMARSMPPDDLNHRRFVAWIATATAMAVGSSEGCGLCS
jgi:hypothetical protein